jgi:hypothetical protein
MRPNSPRLDITPVTVRWLSLAVQPSQTRTHYFHDASSAA